MCDSLHGETPCGLVAAMNAFAASYIAYTPASVAGSAVAANGLNNNANNNTRNRGWAGV
jgi:hypothetical protein